MPASFQVRGGHEGPVQELQGEGAGTFRLTGTRNFGSWEALQWKGQGSGTMTTSTAVSGVLSLLSGGLVVGRESGAVGAATPTASNSAGSPAERPRV